MSKFDLFFSSADDVNGNPYTQFAGSSGTTTATAQVYNRKFTVTMSAGWSGGTKANVEHLIIGTGLNARCSPMQDIRAGDTTATFRVVGFSTGTSMPDGYTVPTGAIFLPVSTSACDLTIDLTDAPSGKYNYLIGGFVALSGEAPANAAIAKLVVTDDLSWSVQEPRPGYYQGKENQNFAQKTDSTTGAYGVDIPTSMLLTAELDSGNIHYIRMPFSSGLNVGTRAKHARIFALRYVPEKSIPIAGDGSSATAETVSFPKVYEMTDAQVDLLNSNENYIFAGQYASGPVGTSAFVLGVPNEEQDQYVIINDGTTNPKSNGENFGGAGLLSLAAKPVKEDTGSQNPYMQVAGSGSGELNNVLFGAFYCPALGFTNKASLDVGNINEAVTGSYQPLLPSVAVEVGKQQSVLMINQAQAAIFAISNSDTRFNLRTSYPVENGTQKDEMTLPLYWRGFSAMSFDVGVVNRGINTLQPQFKTQTSGTITSSSCSSQSFIAGPLERSEYLTGNEKETLAILDTEIIWTKWTTVSTGVFSATITGFDKYDQVTGVSINDTELRNANTGESVVSGSGLFQAIATTSGTTVTVAPGSGVADPTLANTVTALVVPMRFSMLGTDVKMIDRTSSTAPSGYAPMPFPPRLQKSPNVRRTSEIGVSIGGVTLDNSDGGLDDAICQRAWNARRARVYCGNPNVAKTIDDYDLIFEGEMKAPSMDQQSVKINLSQKTSSLTAPLDLGSITEYVGTADANEYTQSAKLPVIYGDVLRAEAVRVNDRTGSVSRYAAMFGDQSFTPSKAYLNASDPAVAFSVPSTSDDADAEIADSVIPGAAPVNRLSSVYLDGRGLDFDFPGEICLDIISRFSSLGMEQIAVESFTAIDRRVLLSVDSLGDRTRNDGIKMGVVLDSSMTVRDALDQVLSTVGGKLGYTNKGRICAIFANYSASNTIEVLPAEARSWATFDGSATANVQAFNGYADRRLASLFKVQSGAPQTAYGVINLPHPGKYAFEAVAVGATFNNPNNLKIEMQPPGQITKQQICLEQIPIDTGYVTSPTWDWRLVSGTFDVPEHKAGGGYVYIQPRTETQTGEIDLAIDNVRIVPVILINNENANLKSITVVPNQYSEAATQFNVNPLRPDAAPTAVAASGFASALPSYAANNRITTPNGVFNAESAMGVASYLIGYAGIQLVEAVITCRASSPPKAGEYAFVELDRIPGFNYPSKIWRISEVNQRSAAKSDFELTIYRESLARVDATNQP